MDGWIDRRARIGAVSRLNRVIFFNALFVVVNTIELLYIANWIGQQEKVHYSSST